jgi:hypothetical protein
MDFRQRNGSDVSAPGLFPCGQFRHEVSVLKISLRASTKVRAGLAESPFSMFSQHSPSFSHVPVQRWGTIYHFIDTSPSARYLAMLATPTRKAFGVFLFTDKTAEAVRAPQAALTPS